MEKSYDSYDFRAKDKSIYTEYEKQLMLILMEFGATIDPYGYDDGDYKEAITKILKLFKTMELFTQSDMKVD